MRFDLEGLKALRHLDRDDVLDAMGLRRKSSTDWIAPTVTALGVGILIGAGLGLLLAPKSGEALRDDLRTRLKGESSEGAKSVAAVSTREPIPRTAL